MSLMDYARLGITFDTTQLRAGILVLDQVAARGRMVGQSADAAGARLTAMGSSARQAAQGAQAAEAATGGLAKQINILSNYSLTTAANVDKLGVATRNLSSNFTSAGQGVSMFAGAVGGLSALIGFQLLAQVSNLIAQLGAIPMATARASDSLTAMQARLRFAFRGDGVAAAQGRQDVIDIARDHGMPYSQLSSTYADLAIAGRGPGLTRQQITGLTDAFTVLGRGSGSRPEEIGRAQWQFQQALSLGRLQSQDYRLMSVAIPTLDDALAAGWENQDGSIGVSPNRIPQMVASGEITANKMVEALIRGVEELRQAGLELPETMATARGRLTTEWELLLEEMGEAIGSSEMVQAMTNAMTDAVAGVRRMMNPDPLIRGQASAPLAWRTNLGMAPLVAASDYARFEAGQQMRRSFAFSEGNVSAEIEAWNAQRESDERQDRTSRSAIFARGHDATRELDPLQYQRQALNGYREQLTAALENSAYGTPEETAAFTRALGQVEAQLGNIMTPFSRMLRDLALARADMATYGPGAGAGMAGRARGIQQQMLPFGGVSMESAMRALFEQGLMGAQDQTAAGMTALGHRRRLLVGSAGQGAEADRLARIELALEGFLSDFGPYANDPRALQARDAERQRLLEESNIELDVAEGRRRGQFGIETDLMRRRIGAAGDPYAMRDLGREAQIEAMRRDTRADLAPGVEADMRERFGLEDQATLTERAAADQERLRTMQEQLATLGRMGQAGRIEMAQLERQQELRRLGIRLTDDQLAAERGRVAENVRVSEQLQLQQERMGLLVDSARAAGEAVSSIFRTAIEEGVATGTIRAETLLSDLGRYTSRILGNIMDAAFLRPLENRITEMTSGLMERLNLPGMATGNGNKGAQALSEAAQQAAEDLASGLTPAITENAVKTGLSTAATAQEAATSALATKALTALTAAAAVAAKAIYAMAAAASTESGGDVANVITSVLGGGGKGGKKFAFGGMVQASPVHFKLASGGVAEWAEAGAEAILPLKRGADGKLGVASSGGGGGYSGPLVVVNDMRSGESAPVESRETQGPDGQRQIELFIKDQVAGSIGRGEFDPQMRAQYGQARVIKKA